MVFNYSSPTPTPTPSFSSTSENYSRDDISDRGGSYNILDTIGFKLLPATRRARKINFRRNGGEFLEILEQQGVQIFPEAKLAEATNNYDDSNKLRDDDFGSVHRGSIEEDNIVVVKKPKDVHKSRIKGNFRRELEFLMKRSHENVVKLKGICLETKIPLLVYEYIPNGTLFEHIHQDESPILKSWGDRFKIAVEAARALRYMHSGRKKPPIVHGNIKSANILLDQSYSAKVSDVGTSILISPDHTHIRATQKQDSLGYIDPEYLTTCRMTIKSDVYSFGVVLVELLTGKKPTSFITKSEKSINIIHYFISSVKDKTLSEDKTRSDVINLEEASEEEMERAGMAAEIAVKCLDQSGAKRPTMREVAEQLSDVINLEDASEEEKERVGMVAAIAVECLDQSGANRPAMSDVARRLADINQSLAVEEDEEYIEETGSEWDEQKPDTTETSDEYEDGEECMSSCLSFLGIIE